MNTVLSVYAQGRFQEYILPAVENTYHKIVFGKNQYHLKEKVEVLFDNDQGIWKIKKEKKPNFSVWYYKEERYVAYEEGQELEQGDIISIRTNFNESIDIIVKKTESLLHPYQKFVLKGTSISISSENKSDIMYKESRFTGRNYATIQKKGEDWYLLTSSGRNGVHINSELVEREQKLVFGDMINILGLHIIFLGKVLAIDTTDKNVTIPDDKSNLIREKKTEDDESITEEQEQTSGKKIYHRSPRLFEALPQGRIEIEEPPALREQEKKSLMMTIGPSITMILPMLTGSMMMIYASSLNGNSNILFRLSGMTVSVLSAGIGLLWTLSNLKNQKKAEKERKDFRFEKYGNYLLEKKNTIEAMYTQTREKLISIYPEAEKCLAYDETTGLLWNRNKSHEDFMTHRLGVGDIPFQVEIQIPAQKFTLNQDELSLMPRELKDEFAKLSHVPVTVDLLKNKLIGVIGGEEKQGAVEIVQMLSAQIAANNCYTDLKLGYIYDDEEFIDSKGWEFARWLPHVWSDDGKTRFVASNKKEASSVFYELTKIFRTRLEREERKEGEIPKPYYVVFVSDASPCLSSDGIKPKEDKALCDGRQADIFAYSFPKGKSGAEHNGALI